MNLKMDTNSDKKYIKGKLIEWAREHINATFDEKRGLLYDSKHNFFRTPDPLTSAEFADGSGNEFKKMTSLHSSSVLVCNVFDYWRNNNPAIVAQALKLTGKYTCINFEKKFHAEISKKNNPSQPPNLDVVLSGPATTPIAIESKFIEFYDRKPYELKPAYLEPPEASGFWKRLDLPDCELLARQIEKEIKLIEPPKYHLNIPQLLKHILGLTKQLGKKAFILVYIWHKISEGDAAKKHHEEIVSFSEKIKDEVNFSYLTYNEFFTNLRTIIGEDQTHAKYLDYNSERYLNLIRK
ncbi:MAG: PGN_0703 family putative restriction endonuclease [Candidatus Zixiibacteriota bacterium]